jgi:hypothetical protein
MRLQRHVYMCLWVNELLQSVKLSTDSCSRMVATAGGWDEVCDNQRWAIDHLLGGKLELFIELDKTENLTLPFRKYCISLRRQVKRKERRKFCVY